MDNLNQVPNHGTISNMVNAINTNFTLVEEMLERLGVSKDQSMGLFATSTALNTAYPSPQVGDWALVGTSSPFAIYTCATAGTWADSGGTYSGGSIDLSDYVTEEEFAEVSDIVLGGEVTRTEQVSIDNDITQTVYAYATGSSNAYFKVDTILCGQIQTGDKLLSVTLPSSGTASSSAPMMRVYRNNEIVTGTEITFSSAIGTTATEYDVSSYNITLQAGDYIAIAKAPYASRATSNRFWDKTYGFNQANPNAFYMMKFKLLRTFTENVDGILEVVDDLDIRIDALENSSSTVETITIANSDKIGVFSNSFMNGYCMRSHHALDNLSMYSDYIFYNFGVSGDDALEQLARINRNATWLGTVPVQQWGIAYGIIAMQDNDVGLWAANPETYYEDFKKLAEAVEGMGGIPILGTEHDSTRYYYALQRLANERGYMFMKWGKTASALFNTVFPPFWKNSHPATRTHWLWTYGMKRYLDTLPRPMRSIKLFKVRPSVSTSDLQNLIYTDNYSRAERYWEIEVGQQGLTAATEKYFDRLNVSGPQYTNYNSEYQKIQSQSGAVSFGSYALIECIMPYDRNNITSLTMNLSATGVSKAYIKRNIALDNPLPITQNLAFGVSAGLSNLSVGGTLTITGGQLMDSDIIGTYTIGAIEGSVVVTTTSSSNFETSGTDVPTCSTSGVTLAGTYAYPSSQYLNRYDKPLGEWVEITLLATTSLTQYLSTCVAYDKVAILLQGTSITISDVSFTCSGSEKKPQEYGKLIERVDGVSALTANTVNDTDTAWTNITNITKYTPVVNPVNSASEALPKGITTVRVLSSGGELKQSLVTANIPSDNYRYYNLQIRILARYFPLYVDSDTDWNSTEISEGSYDCARLGVKIGDYAKVADLHVGAYWNEFIINTPYINDSQLILKCLNKSVQIARVEVDVIDAPSGSAVDTTARSAASAAQTTADLAISRHLEITINTSTTVPTPLSGSSSQAVTEVVCFTHTGAIYGKNGSTYYGNWNGRSNYCDASNVPIRGVTYWSNHVMYQYLNGTLRPLTFFVGTQSDYTTLNDTNNIAFIIEST